MNIKKFVCHKNDPNLFTAFYGFSLQNNLHNYNIGT